MKKAGLLLCAGLLGACAVEMLESRPRRLGPVEGVGEIDSGGGHLRYPLKGGNLAVKQRRKRALKRIAKFCGGKESFAIGKEYTIDDVETSFRRDDLDAASLLQEEHYTVERYRHVHFECVVKE